MFEEQRIQRSGCMTFSQGCRDLDKSGVDLIIAGALSEKDGVGFAVMNRMLKSAGYNIIGARESRGGYIMKIAIASDHGGLRAERRNQEVS